MFSKQGTKWKSIEGSTFEKNDETIESIKGPEDAWANVKKAEL